MILICVKKRRVNHFNTKKSSSHIIDVRKTTFRTNDFLQLPPCKKKQKKCSVIFLYYRNVITYNPQQIQSLFNMYISNMTHFLDEQGNIPKQMPREAREMASFLALIVDTTTKINPTRLTPTDITCFETGCQRTAKVEFLPSKEIHWICSRCENEGRISQWQGTKWDNGYKLQCCVLQMKINKKPCHF